MSDFFSRMEDNKFLTTIETWALLGLNWTQFIKNTEIPQQGECRRTTVIVTQGGKKQNRALGYENRRDEISQVYGNAR